jgi:phage baseplate assembly protein W
MSITINRKVRAFKDIGLDFLPHPATGDIVKVTDDNAIQQSLRSLIMTKNYERPFHPEIGCQVNNLMFENLDFVTSNIIKRTISDTIDNFEPRVKVIDIEVIPLQSNNAIRINIEYTIVNTNVQETFTTILQRLR